MQQRHEAEMRDSDGTLEQLSTVRGEIRNLRTCEEQISLRKKWTISCSSSLSMAGGGGQERKRRLLKCCSLCPG